MSEWISVEDRLPKHSLHYDVWQGGDRVIDCFYSEENKVFYEYEKDHCGYWGWEEMDDVTHWMPLPPPPENTNANK